MKKFSLYLAIHIVSIVIGFSVAHSAGTTTQPTATKATYIAEYSADYPRSKCVTKTGTKNVFFNVSTAGYYSYTFQAYDSSLNFVTFKRYFVGNTGGFFLETLGELPINPSQKIVTFSNISGVSKTYTFCTERRR